MNDDLKARLDSLLAQMKAKPGNPAPYRCQCRDSGMVELESGLMRPCEKCNPRTFALWKAGCFKDGHRGCATCSPGRRSDRSEVYS